MMDANYYNDIVNRPGKFEGEPPHVPYFWDIAMEGGGDHVSSEGEYWFLVTAEDVDVFPYLEIGEWYGVWEDYNGFVMEVVAVNPLDR